MIRDGAGGGCDGIIVVTSLPRSREPYSTEKNDRYSTLSN